MLRMFKQMAIGCLAVFGLFVWLPSSANAVTFTGCLTAKGDFKKMQQGGVPLSPCKNNELQISLNSEGPQGPKGDTGNDGAQGQTGDTGDAGVSGGGLFEFVGYSDNAVNGGVGYHGLTAECVATFGDDARVATTEEYIKSRLTFEPATGGWINPVIVQITAQNNLIDYSGVAGGGPGRWNCTQWGDGSGGKGMRVDTGGDIILGLCTGANFVTCSAPAL